MYGRVSEFARHLVGAVDEADASHDISTRKQQPVAEADAVALAHTRLLRLHQVGLVFDCLHGLRTQREDGAELPDGLGSHAARLGIRGRRVASSLRRGLGENYFNL